MPSALPHLLRAHRAAAVTALVLSALRHYCVPAVPRHVCSVPQRCHDCCRAICTSLSAVRCLAGEDVARLGPAACCRVVGAAVTTTRPSCALDVADLCAAATAAMQLLTACILQRAAYVVDAALATGDATVCVHGHGHGWRRWQCCGPRSTAACSAPSCESRCYSHMAAGTPRGRSGGCQG